MKMKDKVFFDMNVICEDCGMAIGNTICEKQVQVSDAIDSFTMKLKHSGWRIFNGRLLCPGCNNNQNSKTKERIIAELIEVYRDFLKNVTQHTEKTESAEKQEYLEA